MKRNRAYRRFQRRRAIARKKALSKSIYLMDWFQGVDGKYNKGHIGCGCNLCKPGKRFRQPSWEDERKTNVCKQDLNDYRREIS